MAFSTAPLAVASMLGILTCAIAFILIIITIIKSLLGLNDSPDGYPTIICLIFLFSGLQLFSTGILGQYLSKTYLETKKRPVFITKETEEIYLNRKKNNGTAEPKAENVSAETTEEK